MFNVVTVFSITASLLKTAVIWFQKGGPFGFRMIQIIVDLSFTNFSYIRKQYYGTLEGFFCLAQTKIKLIRCECVIVLNTFTLTLFIFFHI